MNDHLHPDERPTPFPDTETRRFSERFAYSPADQEAIDRRLASANAALHAETLALREPIANLDDLEAAIRAAPPGQAIEVEPTLMDDIIKNRHPLLAEREQTHGNFSATALIAQRFKDVSKNTPNWSGGLTDVQRESLEAIFTKIARILSGDPNHPDHWRDVEGQARLVTETLAPF